MSEISVPGGSKSSGSVRIAFLGDVSFVGRYDLSANPEARERFAVIAKMLGDYDYVIANLETPLTDRTTTYVPKSIHLKAPTVNAELLKFLQVSAVTLANNHVYDYGRPGLDDTIEALDRVGIDWFGANGRSLKLRLKGERINVSGFCCYSTNACGYTNDPGGRGVHALTVPAVTKQLSGDEADAALSVVTIHWGDEHTNYPRTDHVRFAHQLLQGRTALIVGHHTHTVQPVEQVGPSVVAFSLGNFCIDNLSSLAGWGLSQSQENLYSLLLDVTIADGRIVDQTQLLLCDDGSRISPCDDDGMYQHIASTYLSTFDTDAYDAARERQIEDQHVEKFGARDVAWLRSRLNYYSIGAYLLGKIRRFQYWWHLKRYIRPLSAQSPFAPTEAR